MLTVDSLADNTTSDGVITLREAIIAANNDAIADATEGMQAGSGPDTIQFDMALFSGPPVSILLTQGVLYISSDLTIIGPGAETLTIDATGNDPSPDSLATDDNFTDDGDGTSVFIVDLGTVSISGLSLTGGDGQMGGAIHSSGVNLSVNDVHMYGNNVSQGGGAIAIYAGGSNVVTVSNSIIGHQNSGLANQAGGSAGGVCVELADDAVVTLDGLQVLNNRSLYGSGGGIYVENGGFNSDAGDFTLQNSTVSGNWAGRFVFTAPTPAFGGGIAVHSFLGYPFRDGSTVFIRNSISDNTTIAEGGGIVFDLSDSREPAPTLPSMTVEIRDTTIANNTAYSQEQFPAPFIRPGGGGLRIATSGKFNTVISNSTISNNRAINGGGFHFTGHNIGHELASAVEIRHSTVTGNVAGPFPPGPYVGGDGFATTVGGGISVLATNYKPPSILLDHAIVAGNVHQQNEGINPEPVPHSDEGINYSPDLGLDPPPSHVVTHPDHPPLTPGNPFYHVYTFNVNYALIGETGGHFALNELAIAGNYITGNPILGPLTDNGGFLLPDGSTIRTHEPQFGSPAIDAGDPSATPNTGTVPEFDQRGDPFTRVFDGGIGDRIDIGAVEVQPAPEEPCPPGDYNDNETVDAADYVVWRKLLGADFQLPNEGSAVSPGTVTDADYDLWVEHFGEVCAEAARLVSSIEVSDQGKAVVGRIGVSKVAAGPAQQSSRKAFRFHPPISSQLGNRDLALLLSAAPPGRRIELDVETSLTKELEKESTGSANLNALDSFFDSYGV